MKLLSHRIKSTHNIYLISDIHCGSVGFSESKFKEALAHVKDDPDGYLCILGDICDNVVWTDAKRFDPDNRQAGETVADHYRHVSRLLEPVKDRILCILEGNHDNDITKTTIANFASDMCVTLGVTYGDYTSKISLRNDAGKLMYKLFLTHGRGFLSSTADDPLRQESNLRLAVKRKLSRLAADCMVMAFGHTHRLIVSRPVRSVYLYDDGARLQSDTIHAGLAQSSRWIHPDVRFYVNTGSFLRSQIVGKTTYAERFMMAPTEIGYAKVVCRDGKVQDVQEVVL